MRAALKRILRRDSFGREALTLMSGTAIAQAVPIAISPILTRLFSPEDYGVFALYAALVGFLSTFAAGRYELAVMLPETDEDADALVILSAIISVGVATVLLVPVLVVRDQIALLFGQPGVAPWLVLVPIGVAVAGIYNALNYWLNRHRKFSRMSTNRVLQSSLGGGLQITLGSIGTAGGLIIGSLLGAIVTTAQLAFGFFRTLGRPRDLVGTMKRLAWTYRNHPKYVMPAHALGSAALQLPVLSVSALFGAAAAGHYAFAYRLMVLPTRLVASALGDVYRQRASLAYREHGEFRRLFIRTVITSASLGIIPTIIFILVAPWIFSLVFGESWAIAGEYAQILAISAYLQFVFTPTDKGPLIVGATKYIFNWNLLRVLLILSAIATTWYFKFDVKVLMWAIVAANSFIYAIDAVVGYFFSGKRVNSS